MLDDGFGARPSHGGAEQQEVLHLPVVRITGEIVPHESFCGLLQAGEIEGAVEFAKRRRRLDVLSEARCAGAVIRDSSR